MYLNSKNQSNKSVVNSREPRQFFSNEQGSPNPKTLLEPVITDPMYAIDAWSPDYIPTFVNKSKLIPTTHYNDNADFYREQFKKDYGTNPEEQIRLDREIAAKAVLDRKYQPDAVSVSDNRIAGNFVDVGVGDKTQLLKMRDRGRSSPYEIVYPMYRGVDNGVYGTTLPHVDNAFSQDFFPPQGVNSEQDLQSISKYYGIGTRDVIDINSQQPRVEHARLDPELDNVILRQRGPHRKDGTTYHTGLIASTRPVTHDEFTPYTGSSGAVDKSTNVQRARFVENYTNRNIPAYKNSSDLDHITLEKPHNIENNDSSHLMPNSYQDVPRYFFNKFDDCKTGRPDMRGNEMPSNLAIADVEIDKRFENFNRELYTQTIQPGMYGTYKYNEPINNNIGISHTEQFQPLVVTKSVTQSPAHYYFNRIDPQLVRDDDAQNRMDENPIRNNWSAPLSTEPEDKGTIPIENIYDPRLTGYGDHKRGYFDITTGQWRYYYGDIDAYKQPTFITRSKVDHIDFQDPMGKISPEYHRRIGAENYKKISENAFSDNALAFRESMMESLMRKKNSESWQQRAYPLRNQHVGTCNYVK